MRTNVLVLSQENKTSIKRLFPAASRLDISQFLYKNNVKDVFVEFCVV